MLAEVWSATSSKIQIYSVAVLITILNRSCFAAKRSFGQVTKVTLTPVYLRGRKVGRFENGNILNIYR